MNARKVVQEADEMIRKSRSMKRNVTGLKSLEGRKYLKSPPAFKCLAFLPRPGTPKFTKLKTTEARMRNTSFDFDKLRREKSRRKYRRNGKLHILVSR